MLRSDTEKKLEPETWSAPVRELYDYWLSIHPSPDQLPSRSHFDPLDVHKLLSLIWMFDVSRDPFRCKFRLIGTEIVHILGSDTTGQWMDEAFPEVVKTGVNKDYEYAALNNKPLYRNGVPQYYVPEHRHIERIILPLVNEKQQCDILLGLSVYT